MITPLIITKAEKKIKNSIKLNGCGVYEKIHIKKLRNLISHIRDSKNGIFALNRKKQIKVINFLTEKQTLIKINRQFWKVNL